MEKSTLKRLLLVVVVVPIIIIIVVAATIFSRRGGGDDKPFQPPDALNASECPAEYGPRPLLLVSIDGFRADYLVRNLTPTLQMVAQRGVHAEYMMPSYPTVTFPNHYTIVTGLLPESHGIVANKFFDPDFKEMFSLSGHVSKEGRWWGGEPIWNAVTRQGKKSSTFFWPGSDADINGKYPTNYKVFDHDVPFEQRVLEVLEWLSLDKDHRPSFVSLYFEEPDHEGHAKGPDSEESNEQLERIDKIINMLMAGLEMRNLIHCVNVILLSDHGMTKAGKERVIDLKEYIPDLRQEAYFQRSVVSMIQPKNKTSEEVALEMMRSLTCVRDEMRVYLKEGLPKRMHYSKNPRIFDILIEMDLGHTTQFNSSWALEGQHGYDNYYAPMNALFIAYGPDFKQNTTVKPFQNIELYNLMCHLIDIEPAVNNGTWGSLHHLLENPPQPPSDPQIQKLPVLRFPSSVDLKTLWNESRCDQGEFKVEKWVSTIELNETQEKLAESKHLPWGIPKPTSKETDDVTLLYHADHVTGFSPSLKMPLWTSFTLDNHNVAWFEPEMGKWTSDFRLNETITPSCDVFHDLLRFDYHMFILYPTSLAAEQSGESSPSYLVSNAIPVHSSLKKLWTDILGSYLPHWIENYGPLNILMGPVFDTVDNPHISELTDRKIPVPSDLFIVLTHCLQNVTSLDLCHPENLDTRSFILHQYTPVKNCFKSEEEPQLKFSATVKDVEHFSHFRLFPTLAFEDRINLTLRSHPHFAWTLA